MLAEIQASASDTKPAHEPVHVPTHIGEFSELGKMEAAEAPKKAAKTKAIGRPKKAKLVEVTIPSAN